MPTTDPQSYRFQVWSLIEKPGPLGESVRALGEILWEEPPGRELDWSVRHRVASAMYEADRLAAERGARVVCGTKALFDSSDLTACYFTSGPITTIPSLSVRDHLLLTAEGGGL